MFEKNFTIPLSIFIALSCGSVNAADKSTAFNDAVANLAGAQSFQDAAQRNYKAQLSAVHQAQAAEKDALNNFNIPNNDRQISGLALTQAEQDVMAAQKKANIARSDVRFAADMVAKTQQQVNGTNYRTQIRALQAANMGPTPQTQKVPTIDATAYRNLISQQQAALIGPTAKPQNPNVPTIDPAAYRNAIAQQQAALMGPSAPQTNSDIKQAADNIPANTPVSVTIGDQTYQTTAGEIAKVNPQAQISVPFVSAFVTSTRRGNNNGTGNNGMRAGHEGRGAENAHSHAFGGHGYGSDNSRSEGFGGHSHFH